MGYLVVLEGKSRSLLVSDNSEEACSVDVGQGIEKRPGTRTVLSVCSNSLIDAQRSESLRSVMALRYPWGITTVRYFDFTSRLRKLKLWFLSKRQS